MSYPFPNVRQCCPLCGNAGCARWKGYFVRSVICGDLEYAGPVAIHVGHCKELGTDFSYFPDFLIAGRKLSRRTFKRFAQDFVQAGSIRASIDGLIAKVPLDDFTVALSSAYEWLYQAVRALRLNAGALAIRVEEGTSIGVVMAVRPGALDHLFLAKFIWHPAHHMLCYPP